MGRPRKRQYVEESEKDSVDVNLLDFSPSVDLGHMPDLDDNFQFDSMHAPAGTPFPKASVCSARSAGNCAWQFGDGLMPTVVDFTTPEPLPDAIPELDDTPRDSPTDMDILLPYEHSPPKSGAKCSCLAAMYLALSALQELPNSIPQAMVACKEARDAADTALNCQQCWVSPVFGETPDIAGFQVSSYSSTGCSDWRS
jgi:hypothetical protein